MISFVKQRWIGMTLLVLLSAGVVAAHAAWVGSVPRLSYISGWILFVVMVFLAAYNGRKKLPFLPLISSEAWLHFHIYAGWLTVILFLAHINFKVPTGWFEGSLAWLYVVVTLSGIVGLALSRLAPKRLTTHGGEVIYERIPAIRRGLQEQVESLALGSIAEARSATIAEFYVRKLKHFLEGNRNVWLHLMEVRRPLNILLNQINDLNRYLNDKERETMDKIAGLVRQKDALDYHHAVQATLKGWLFVHIPVTYSLLLFSFVHIILVFAFSGGVR